MGTLEAAGGMLLFGISKPYLLAPMQICWPMLSRRRRPGAQPDHLVFETLSYVWFGEVVYPLGSMIVGSSSPSPARLTRRDTGH
jgi:hypothetical protein